MENNTVNTETEDSLNPEEEQFETTPEQATGLGQLKPGSLNRKKLMIVLCSTLAAIICGGLIFNSLKPAKKKTSANNSEFASSNHSNEFLSGLRDRAINRRLETPPAQAQQTQETAKEEKEPEPTLPPVSFNKPPETKPPPAPQPNQQAPASNAQKPTHFKSPLVPPVVEGSLFSQSSSQNIAPRPSSNDTSSAAQAARNYGQSSQINDYAAQNDQQNKQSFFDSSSGGGTVSNGQYIGANAVWIGTIIPGILETAINTDLPGNVLARVTQNIYDSKSGRNLLIPQGTLLIARYNSSISYAQKRIQIVWDTMIRPDGFQIDLDGAGGVDRSGMSGQPAKFHENWFEYLKAAAIITLFSYANAKMTETAAKYTSEDSASNLAASNADFVGELGGRLASRATNIQPTLTVENGTLINIMLNKNLYLPPVAGVPASQKYLLE